MPTNASRSQGRARPSPTLHTPARRGPPPGVLLRGSCWFRSATGLLVALREGARGLVPAVVGEVVVVPALAVGARGPEREGEADRGHAAVDDLAAPRVR